MSGLRSCEGGCSAKTRGHSFSPRVEGQPADFTRRVLDPLKRRTPLSVDIARLYSAVAPRFKSCCFVFRFINHGLRELLVEQSKWFDSFR